MIAGLGRLSSATGRIEMCANVRTSVFSEADAPVAAAVSGDVTRVVATSIAGSSFLAHVLFRPSARRAHARTPITRPHAYRRAAQQSCRRRFSSARHRALSSSSVASGTIHPGVRIVAVLYVPGVALVEHDNCHVIYYARSSTGTSSRGSNAG